MQRVVVDDGFRPVGLAFVFRKQVWELRVRLVDARPAAGFDRLRRPDELTSAPWHGPAATATARSPLRRSRLLSGE